MVRQSVPEIVKRVKHVRAPRGVCESSPLPHQFVTLQTVNSEEAKSVSAEIILILMLVAFMVGMMTGISLTRPGTR